MTFYQLREEDKRFLYALMYATGLILFWRGIWEVSYEIPLLENVYFVLFVGLFILTMSGVIYREFDLFGQRLQQLNRVLHDVQTHAKRGEVYTVHYFDEHAKDEHKINGKDIQKVEQNFIVIHDKKHERYIPLGRVTNVTKGKKTIWKR